MIWHKSLISLPGNVPTVRSWTCDCQWQKWSREKSFSVPLGYYAILTLLFSPIYRFWMWYFLILASTESNFWQPLQEAASLVKTAMLQVYKCIAIIHCECPKVAWSQSLTTPDRCVNPTVCKAHSAHTERQLGVTCQPNERVCKGNWSTWRRPTQAEGKHHQHVESMEN